MTGGAACLAWDAVELLVLCIRHRAARRGIHPGAHVGVQLVLWLLCAAMGTWLAVVIAGLQEGDYYSYVPSGWDEEGEKADLACVGFLFGLA